jgi:Fe-S cluster biogenesis protein NfuA
MSLGLKQVKPSPMFRLRSDIRCPDAALSLETRMFIQTEETPNPATLKFLPGREVIAAGVVDFTAPEAAERSPLARRVFAVDGVTGVFLGADFITVTKAAGEDWYVLKPAVLGAIMEHYLSGDPVVEADLDLGDETPAGEEDDQLVRQIRELIDTRVRPAVAQDGGDIIFRGFERGVVYLHMRGACAGCPSSAITLKNGIENLLRYYVPEVTEVRQVA